MIKIGSPIGRAIILILVLAVPCGSLAFAQKSTTTNDQDAPPIAGDSGFTSPLSGRNVGAGSDEQQFFSDLLDEYHQMKVAEENLNYAKLCGSKQDINKATAELKTYTELFNELMAKYIYSFPGTATPSNPDGNPQQHYGDRTHGNSDYNQQRDYDQTATNVIAALARADKPVPRHGGCGDQAIAPAPPAPKPRPSPPPLGSGVQLVNGVIGVVMPTDTRAGDQVSATVVTNPKAYEGVPGLQVAQATLPLTRDAQGVATLSGVVVETGNNKLQSAEGGILVEVARSSEKLTMQFLTDGSDTPVAEQALHVGTGFGEPPIWPPSEIQQLPPDLLHPPSTVFKVKGPPDPKNWEPSSVQRIQVDEQPRSTVMKPQGPREPKIWNPSECSGFTFRRQPHTPRSRSTAKAHCRRFTGR